MQKEIKNHSSIDTSCKEVHIFLCFTTFQSLISSYISKNVEGITILVDVYNTFRGDVCKWDYVISRQQAKTNSVDKGIMAAVKRIQHSKKLFQELTPLLESANKVTIYHSHLEEYLVNYMYFKYNHSCVQHNIIQDGILNYYPLQVAGVRRWKHIAKWFLSHLALLPFTPYQGHITGVDRQNITKQYLLGAKNHSMYPNKSQHVQIDVPNNQDISDEVLIVGQEHLQSSLGNVSFSYYMKNLIRCITQEFAGKAIYYKPRYIHLLDDSMRHHISSHGITILHDNRCLEEIYTENVKRYLVSFFSSALMNIKLLFGNRVECYSFALVEITTKMMSHSHQETLKNLFSAIGIDEFPVIQPTHSKD